MNFAVALFIYLLVLLLLIYATQRSGMTGFSGMTLSLLLSAILLALMVPFPELDKHVDKMADGDTRKETLDTVVWIYILLYVLTLIVVTWYVLDRSLSETCRFNKCALKGY